VYQKFKFSFVTIVHEGLKAMNIYLHSKIPKLILNVFDGLIGIPCSGSILNRLNTALRFAKYLLPKHEVAAFQSIRKYIQSMLIF
jgi:hypothetical protein